MCLVGLRNRRRTTDFNGMRQTATKRSDAEGDMGAIFYLGGVDCPVQNSMARRK